jgi:hypothetical protein
VWTPSNICIAILLVLDTFFVSFAIGFNSRYVLVIDRSLAPIQRAVSTTPLETPASVTTSAVEPAPTQTGTEQKFSDLTATETRLQDSLKSAAKAGILDPTQDEKFHPNEPVTRADFTRWMVRIMQVKALKPAQPSYTDLPSANPYYGDIEGATAKMLVQGYALKGSASKEFRPDQFIKREEFAVLYGTFSGKRGRAETLKKDEIEKYLHYNPSTTDFGKLTYKDAGDIDDWARKWVAVAHQAGVLDQAFATDPYADENSQKFFRPQQRMTRAEAVNILVKLYGLGSKQVVTQSS